MDIYSRKSRWKIYLALAGLVIVAISLLYTNYLATNLANEERKKINQLKTAYETISFQDYTETECDVTFQSEFFISNTTIPIIVVDDAGKVVLGKNYGDAKDTDIAFLTSQLASAMDSGLEPVTVHNPEGDFIMYPRHSRILTLLRYFPFFQFIIIGAFILFGYLAFNSARRAEQNRVWVGMAKETAHQLGTPISGIVAWIEHLKEMNAEEPETLEILHELTNDVGRLDLIADRFSKIGSAPELNPTNVYDAIEHSCVYMKRRASRKVIFEFPLASDNDVLDIMINPHLFNWVVENILRNALDAVGGEGKIEVGVAKVGNKVEINISDTGKGIPSSKHQTVFEPGYTTKKRGWGLGLSLAKRIIDQYHKGRIFVRQSAVNKGTTFTIQLPFNS